jgi:hypothetical protein
MLDLYYHLHGEDTQQAMLALAETSEKNHFRDTQNSTFEGNGTAKNRENAASSTGE